MNLRTIRFKKAIEDPNFIKREEDALAEDYLSGRRLDFLNCLDGDRRDSESGLIAMGEYNGLPSEVRLCLGLVLDFGMKDSEYRENISVGYTQAIKGIKVTGIDYAVPYRVYLANVWWALLVGHYQSLPNKTRHFLEHISEEYAAKNIQNDLSARLAAMECHDLMEKDL